MHRMKERDRKKGMYDEELFINTQKVVLKYAQI